MNKKEGKQKQRMRWRHPNQRGALSQVRIQEYALLAICISPIIFIQNQVKLQTPPKRRCRKIYTDLINLRFPAFFQNCHHKIAIRSSQPVMKMESSSTKMNGKKITHFAMMRRFMPFGEFIPFLAGRLPFFLSIPRPSMKKRFRGNLTLSDSCIFFAEFS